jgi:hypothetical protein
VLRHPAFVARHRRGDAQRETLFPEQRVAAVAGAEAPDLARLGEVDDILLLVARPRHVLRARAQRRAERMHAWDDAFEVAIDQLEDLLADPRHDPHVHDDVGRVGELDADLRHGRADRAHAERQHIHRAPLHAAAEKTFQCLPHGEGIDPVVRRAGGLLRERADERSSTRATSLASLRAR